MPNVNLADMLLWFVAFLFSATAHEAAHALAAMRGGDPTAYHGGQVTLNPIPHMLRSPFGTVVVPLVSYFLWGWMIGWASAPYDPNWALKYPRRAAFMAAAGPAANLIILLVAFMAMKAGLAAGVWQTPELDQIKLTGIVVAQGGLWAGLAKLASILFILNLILFIFNLFPFPPLDGSSVVTVFMPPPLAQKFTHFMRQPMYSLLGMVLAWRLFGMIFRDLFVFSFKLIHPGSNYF